MDKTSALNSPLTELQLRIMEILWIHGEASVSRVREELQPDHSLARTTVATLLARMEDKGLVKHRREGREFLFSPQFERDQVLEAQVREFTGRVFRQDISALVSNLLGSEQISPDELKEIRRLIKEAERRNTDD